MIRCAALKVHLLYDNKTAIICGVRHGDCHSILHDLSIDDYEVLTEGFMTEDNIFLDRYEALTHAKEIGQISPTALIKKEEDSETQLYSEDLW